jgi:hypothetical protein
MGSFDDLFQHGNEQPVTQNSKSFDKEAWKKQKQEQREMVYSMIENTAEDVARDGVKFQSYLDVQSRFDYYSVANALLILAQKPDATRIADFDTWKEQGAYIRKKETGFYILEPGDEYRRDDGTVGISYNLKKMFDISQTGDSRKRETPTYPDDRTRIKALMDHAPVPICISDALQATGFALLVLFFVIGVVKTCGSFAEVKKPEHALKLFIRFALAKGVVTYGLELMMALFNIVQGIISTIMNSSGLGSATQTVLPNTIVQAVEDCGFLMSIPLWAVTLIGGHLQRMQVRQKELSSVPIHNI